MKYDLKYDSKHEGLLRKTRFNTVSIIRAHSSSESRSIMSVCMIAPANKLSSADFTRSISSQVSVPTRPTKQPSVRLSIL
jgi:hypothetical protein